MLAMNCLSVPRRFLFVYLGAQLLQRFDFLILAFSVILAILAFLCFFIPLSFFFCISLVPDLGLLPGPELLFSFAHVIIDRLGAEGLSKPDDDDDEDDSIEGSAIYQLGTELDLWTWTIGQDISNFKHTVKITFTKAVCNFFDIMKSRRAKSPTEDTNKDGRDIAETGWRQLLYKGMEMDRTHALWL